MDDDLPDGRPGLALLSLSNKAEFDAAFAALAQPISDYSFAAAFCWGQAMGLYFARLNGHLCLFANGSDLTMLLPPIAEPGATGEDLRACLTRAFELMDSWNKDHGGLHLSRIEYVSDEMLERIRSVTGGSAEGSLQLSAAPMGGDYIYPVANMIDLPGGDLKSKRGAKNRFIREYPSHRAELMQPEHKPLCLELLNRWRSHGDTVHEGQVTLDSQQKSTADLRRRDQIACTTAVERFDDLGMKGMVLFVDDKLVGFTLGESLSPSQASILFEKTDPQYNGVAQFIFSEFCRLCWKDKPEINVGDDWGIPTLRFTKQSYRPTRTPAKYVMTRPVSVPVMETAVVPVEASAG
ncbi:MAG: phosphatidylglycerol lysyltransferase domain-containing protein [Phycisphaeraceae bacterium]